MLSPGTLPTLCCCYLMLLFCSACVPGLFHRHCDAPISVYLSLAALVCYVTVTATAMYLTQNILIKLAQAVITCNRSHALAQPACDVQQETHERHICSYRNILAVVGPPGSGKSVLVAAMCGRLYKPAKATGKILISGKEAYESFKPTWFSANDVLTSHLTVHQYLLYKGMCPSRADSSKRTEKGCSISCLPASSVGLGQDSCTLQQSPGKASRQLYLTAKSWQSLNNNTCHFFPQCSCDRLLHQLCFSAHACSLAEDEMGYCVAAGSLVKCAELVLCRSATAAVGWASGHRGYSTEDMSKTGSIPLHAGLNT